MEAEGRMELVRKYGAIYGRFDSKRKNEKPMTLHEVRQPRKQRKLALRRLVELDCDLAPPPPGILSPFPPQNEVANDLESDHLSAPLVA